MTDYLSYHMDADALERISMLGLAHVGDAVYDLMVRAWLCAEGRATAAGLHRAALEYVSAAAQCRAARIIIPHLTPEELAVYRRGRNARVKAVPRSATPEQYHAATAVETLFGHLYLAGEQARLSALFGYIVDAGPPPQPAARRR